MRGDVHKGEGGQEQQGQQEQRDRGVHGARKHTNNKP